MGKNRVRLEATCLKGLKGNLVPPTAKIMASVFSAGDHLIVGVGVGEGYLGGWLDVRVQRCKQ